MALYHYKNIDGENYHYNESLKELPKEYLHYEGKSFGEVSFYYKTTEGKITDIIADSIGGEYDDYVFNVSEKFDEPVSIWNAWYAGNGIAYANIILESDLSVWDNLYENYGQLYEIDLNNKTVTKLNIPKAPLSDIFSLNSVKDGKFIFRFV